MMIKIIINNNKRFYLNLNLNKVLQLIITLYNLNKVLQFIQGQIHLQTLIIKLIIAMLIEIVCFLLTKVKILFINNNIEQIII